MAETTMPAAEAAATASEMEQNSYELAFHVLPTVAEGEVSSVFEELKTLITKNGGEIFSEEAPERVDLAYEIVKGAEGKNKRYKSAYFGWVRFKLEGAKLEKLDEAVQTNQSLLRTLVIKLTKAEEQNPFWYHESRKTDHMVTEISDEEAADVLADPLLGAEDKNTAEETPAKDTAEEK